MGSLPNIYFFGLFLYSEVVKGAVSSQGQVTIPKAVREAVGIGPGDRVEFEARDSEIVIKKADSGINWERVYGVIDFGGRTTDQIMAELRPPLDIES